MAAGMVAMGAAGLSGNGAALLRCSSKYGRQHWRVASSLKQQEPEGRSRNDESSKDTSWKLGRASEILSALSELKNDEGAAPIGKEQGQNPRLRRWPTRDGVPLVFWKQRVIQKKARDAAERDRLDSRLDDAAYLNEEWKQRRISWMLREIPRMDPRETVKILNSQMKWIRNRDISIMCSRLLDDDNHIRAHRVLKWGSERPWFQVDFELLSRMSQLLVATGRVGRGRDLYDILIRYAFVPKETTFTSLIKGYLEDGRPAYVEEAWRLYMKMINFGHYEPPPELKFTVFKYLAEFAKANPKCIERADSVFKSLREANLTCSSEMYENLIALHSVHGDEQEVDNLVDDMRSSGVEVSPLIFGAIIKTCSKTGNYRKAEEVFSELKEIEQPDWRYYVALIEAYGKAGLYERALELFQDLTTSAKCPLSVPYKTVIEVMAAGNQVQDTERLLKQEFEGTIRYQIMQPAFNAVMEMYIRNGMADKVGNTFEEMKKRGCQPSRDSTNLLLKSYVELGQLEKAESFYQKMLDREFLTPNSGTYEVMIEAFGRANKQEKVKEVFERLTANKHPIPEEFQHYVDDAVNRSWIIQAKQYCQPNLTLTERSMVVGALLGGARMKALNRRAFEVHFEQEASSFKGQVLIKHLYDIFAGWAVDRPRVKSLGALNESLRNSVGTAEALQESSDDEEEAIPDLGGVQQQEHRPSSSSELQVQQLHSNEAMTTEVLHLQLMGHIKFRFYAAQYRPEGYPHIPRLIHRWLNPVSLAYWYMYNGRRSSDPPGIILNCEPYPYVEAALVGEALRAKSMHCFLKQEMNKNYLLLVGASSRWLWRQMEPYIVKELVPMLKPEDLV